MSAPARVTHDSRPWGVTLDQLGAVLGLPDAAVPAHAPGIRLNRVSIDSRAVEAGDLFVALRGERVDGHDFVRAAFDRGAAAVLVERSLPADVNGAVLQVPSCLAALARLAGWWREQVDPVVIAITGSNGKTTLKEMVATILVADAQLQGLEPAHDVLATEGNFNNHLGLPLTLLRLRFGHRRAVLELGMNHAGELTALSRLARPDVAVVNNVQRAHVGLLGSLDAVAEAKAEIFAGLDAHGTAVINADDPYADLMRLRSAPRRQIDFSCSRPADIGPVQDSRDFAEGQVLRIAAHGRVMDCVLPLHGRHNASNALAAIAVASAIGIAPEAAAIALETFGGVPGRLRPTRLASGAEVIDDTYNANPDSVLAALAVLMARPGRRILVLGDLGELGESAPQLHAELGTACREAGLDQLFGLGTLVAHAVRSFGPGARLASDPAELVDWLKPLLGPDTTILVKGSRFMRMERIVAGLTT